MRQAFGIFCLVAAILLNLPGGSIPVIPLPIPFTPDSPVPGTGFNLLIVEDRSARPDLVRANSGQFDTMFSTLVEDAVATKNGNLYRYDRNQDVSQKDDWVQRAMRLTHGSYPWYVLDHNGKGLANPLPSTPRELVQIIERY